MDRERERVLTAYERLRVHHPALPPNLRDFQVVFHMKRRNFEGEFLFEQVDLISAMTNSEAKDHLLGALPTGYGKSLPMLVASLLLPPGTEFENLHLLAVLKLTFTGSTIVVICPLTTIAQQLMNDCSKYGINALAGHQVKPEEFETTLKSNRPRMIIANVEFIASPEVRLVVRDQLWQSALGERCSSGL